MKKINKIQISGKMVWPIIEGGKGVGASDGRSAGAFASSEAVGTLSGACTMPIDANGMYIRKPYQGTTRNEKHAELVENSISAILQHVDIAHKLSNGNGAIHINVLWEMGGVEQILRGVLPNTQGKLHGITCGAGLPYRLVDLAYEYNVYYYPIVSSERAFRILWKRAYSKHPTDLLGGVVYEDPWLAGGHNGISNSEDPNTWEPPFERVVALRRYMNSVNLAHIPIIMAGGVWNLSEWDSWLESDAIGPIAFQFGTRALLTKESPIPSTWKQKLMHINKGEVILNRFSPTGFYSSAVNNDFLQELHARNQRQVPYSETLTEKFNLPIPFGPRKRIIYVQSTDQNNIKKWIESGYDDMMKTPDNTIIFVTKAVAEKIHKDQIDCKGCLSNCKFSNWSDNNNYTTGLKPDPRTFCIHNTLRKIVTNGNIDNELMFSGHSAYRFKDDPLYANGNIPTVRELVDAILNGC